MDPSMTALILVLLQIRRRSQQREACRATPRSWAPTTSPPSAGQWTLTNRCLQVQTSDDAAALATRLIGRE
jgi:hypothetical protein